jgi:hypothetical protein
MLRQNIQRLFTFIYTGASNALAEENFRTGTMAITIEVEGPRGATLTPGKHVTGP